jgi:hypothetical protein
MDYMGCEKCLKKFGDGSGFVSDEDQNYERKPIWKGSEEVAKQTYYTKCGRQFEKSSTAGVTGYEMSVDDKKCAECPFQIDVREGYPETVHKRWECRAGSKPPNQKDDWGGNIDDKCNIHIKSLHNDFLESVIEYCKDHLDLSAGYSQDIEDCRRVISIGCSSNKKGIAAKKALIEKFFPVQDDTSKKHCCGDCDFGHWYSGENTYVNVVSDDGAKTIKRPCDSRTHYCYQFAEGQKKIASDKDFNPHSAPEWCPLKKESDLDSTLEYLKGGTSDDVENGSDEGIAACDTDDCPFNDREGHCLYEKDEDGDGFWSDIQAAVNDYGCKNEDVLLDYKIITDPDSCDLPEDETDSTDLEDQLDHLLAKGDEEDKTAADEELLSTLIGKEIRTHYNTGGIVTNIAGQHPANGPGLWTINYTKDGKKSKNPCIINSIGIENGVITCEGKPLQIIEKEEAEYMVFDDSKLLELGNKATCKYFQGFKKGLISDHIVLCGITGEESEGNNLGANDSLMEKNFLQACCNGGECIRRIKLDGKAKEAKVADIAISELTSNTVQPFDYSTVDEETAEFLQEKANRITEIRIKSVIALGKELKEAQDRLANNKTGTFGIWCESIGIKKDTAYRNINAYDYIIANCEDITFAEKIQPSLLFAASKPSAPKELSEKVATGDITTHKQYKELEDKLKKLTEEKKKAEAHYMETTHIFESNTIKAELALKKAEKERDNTFKAYQKDLKDLNQQLDQAKRNGDPTKVKELGEKISEYQKDIRALEDTEKNLNVEINTLRRQLKEKPIEAAAAKVVEKVVIPEEIKVSIFNKVSSLFEGIINLTDAEIQVFAESVRPVLFDDVVQGISDAIDVLNNINSAVYAAAELKGEQEAAPTSDFDPDKNCGICKHADMDGVTEEELDDNKTRCKVSNETVDFEHRCGRFEDMRG